MRFALIERPPYARDGQGEVPHLSIARLHDKDDAGHPDICIIVGIPPVPGTEHGNPALAGDPDRRYKSDHALTRRYAECMVEALNREFGTPEDAPPVTRALIVAGQPMDIPPALDEIAGPLISGWSKPPLQRSAEEHRAVARFIEYCDGNGITLPRRTTPMEGAGRDDIGERLAVASETIAARQAAAPSAGGRVGPPRDSEYLAGDPTELGPGEAETDRILKQGRE